jgi:hypothetical protein
VVDEAVDHCGGDGVVDLASEARTVVLPPLLDLVVIPNLLAPAPSLCLGR